MSEPFDVNTPSPDDGHEAIRVAVVGAIEELGYTTDDAGLSLDLTDTLFALLDGLMAQNSALNIRADAQEINYATALASIDDLQRRVAVLEANNPPADQPQELADGSGEP